MIRRAAGGRWAAVVAAGTLLAWAAPDASAAGGTAGGRRIDVSVRNGSLAARIQEAPLAEALAAVGRAAEARVTIRHADAAAPVSLHADSLMVEEGVRRLLRGHSYVLVYGDDVPGGKLAEIIVLGRHRPASDDLVAVSEAVETPATPAPGQDTRDHEVARDTARKVGVPRPERALPPVVAPGALEAIPPPPPRPGGGAVTLALVNADERLRLAALAQIQDGTEAAPMRMLTRMAREDTSPTIRMQALEILADQSAARARGPLRQALRDQNPEVQYRALELLDRIGPDSRPQGGAPAASPAAAGTTARSVAPPISQQGP